MQMRGNAPLFKKVKMRHKPMNYVSKSENPGEKMRKTVLKYTLALFFALLIVSQVFAAKKAHPTPAPEPEPRQITDFTKKSETAAKGDKAAVESSSADALASEQPKESPLYTYDEPKVEEPSMGWMFFKTVFVLGIFGAGFYFFFKYVKKKTGMASAGQGAAQILSVVPLGQNKFLQIVDIGNRLLIVGVCDANITLISEVRERDEIDRLRLLSSKSISPMAYGFQDFVSEHVGSLIDFIGKKRSGVKNKKEKHDIYETEYLDDERIDYMKSQRDRLRKMSGRGEDNGK
jgi:flagellar biogenesis protein FliO